MNQKLRAMGLVAAMLTICVTVTLALRIAFTYITPELAPVVLGAVGIGICLYILYSVSLAYIQFNDKLKDMVDRK